MREVEAKLHELLESIAGDVYGSEDLARIVAVASARCERVAAVRESQMMEALFDAMENLGDWEDEPADRFGYAGFLDGRGMTAQQILKAAASRTDPIPDFGVDVMGLEDGDLDVFLGQTPDRDPNGYIIDDAMGDGEGRDPHRPSLYSTPGRGRHRSDSQSRSY